MGASTIGEEIGGEIAHAETQRRKERQRLCPQISQIFTDLSCGVAI